ncbi:matrixin family metalloprotease [Solitalea canadensis]|uniref:Putative Zn-dependent protease n=1 Tax=Solitalea canadensis (strain ATCC 29591 / DSM 3403 / JCM 21819 / LMG 8368 / NBRC 15130 / NCIMB 12057 / USAM 9D) TaxID=929556 RepID=H8KN31_SOLCM|nr:matrixin family metalloprotease [Solitalea canadensis]AFD09110.1 putative Zn-dependent protease [Solitalea canadensis DSM 3403]
MNSYLSKTTILLLTLFTSISACNKPTKETVKEITIAIQPFGNFSDDDARYIASEIQKAYPKVEIMLPMDFPSSAYKKDRKRYRADSLINYLSRKSSSEHVTIGLTDEDISATKDEHKDWGVMGLGFCPGNACIASTFRLSKEQKLDQLFKVAIHELGHTQGLPHCAVKTCFMRDAEGKNPTNEEKEFCKECKRLLINKGWHLR